MKKTFLFLLILFIFNNNVFASSKKIDMKKKQGAIEGCFNYLMKTRGKKEDKNVIKERQEAEELLMHEFVDEGPEVRQLTIDVFNERKTTFHDRLEEHILNGDGKEYLSVECLEELDRIASIIGLEQ